MKIRIHPLPYAADVAFAIRDDDIGYFTPLEKLEKIYRCAWDMGFKVSFSVIPMHKGTNNLNVPPDFRNDAKYYPITQNKNLVEYLKTKITECKVDILQHGFCHTENSNLPALKFDLEKGNLSSINERKIDLAKYSEFYGASKKDVSSRLEKGKNILEKLFGVPIKVFVAPQELLTKPLWMALWEGNLNCCGGIGRNIITQIPINHINFSPLLKAATKYVFRINSESIAEDITHLTDIITVPATHRHYWNKFASDELSEYWFNHFEAIFEIKKKQKGYFILLTHYWEYFYDWEDEITQKRQHEYLNKVFKYVDNNSSVWKCTVSELVDWIMARDSIMIKKKQGEIKIFSPYNIRGFSIQLGENIGNFHNENTEIKEINGISFIILDMKARQSITLSTGGM